MAKAKRKMEFRFYDIPKGEYVLPMLGDGWEREYGAGYGTMLHFHNYLEIGYCYHGSGRLIINDRVYRYGDQMFTVIPANIPHTTISDPGNICKWEFLFIDVDSFVKNEVQSLDRKWGGTTDFLKNINSRGTLKSRENHPNPAQLIRSIIRECRKKDDYYMESLKGYIYSLLIEIIRLNEERERLSTANNLQNHIRDVIAYVDEHYAEEIRVSDMADACGLSESHFRRTFEETMNTKPVEYINLVRIDKACELITAGGHSMEEVSFIVGYQTPSTFNRNFKLLTGTTPLKWKAEGGDRSKRMEQYHISASRGWDGTEDKHGPAH